MVRHAQIALDLQRVTTEFSYQAVKYTSNMTAVSIVGLHRTALTKFRDVLWHARSQRSLTIYVTSGSSRFSQHHSRTSPERIASSIMCKCFMLRSRDIGNYICHYMFSTNLTVCISSSPETGLGPGLPIVLYLH